MARLSVLAWPLTTAAFVVACSSEPAIPQAALTSKLEVTNNAPSGSERCPLNGDWVNVGKFKSIGQESTSLVVDGGNQDGFNVSVDCLVIDRGGKFEVSLKGEVRGTEGGVVRIDGEFTPEGEQTNINATFRRGDYGQFSSDQCKVVYQDVNGKPGIDPGRIWGTLICDNVTNLEKNQVCRSTVQFRFENCAQE